MQKYDPSLLKPEFYKNTLGLFFLLVGAYTLVFM